MTVVMMMVMIRRMLEHQQQQQLQKMCVEKEDEMRSHGTNSCSRTMIRERINALYTHFIADSNALVWCVCVCVKS